MAAAAAIVRAVRVATFDDVLDANKSCLSTVGAEDSIGQGAVSIVGREEKAEVGRKTTCVEVQPYKIWNRPVTNAVLAEVPNSDHRLAVGASCWGVLHFAPLGAEHTGTAYGR
jgi:hypothetical protein